MEKDFSMVFVDLEKAYDSRVPRDLISWAIRKRRISVWLVKVIHTGHVQRNDD